MAERYDSVRDAEAAEYLPLARAAALVHARLFPQESAKDVKTLDLLGLAISALIPLYQRDMKSGAVRALEGADIARGRFSRGASRLEIAGRAPLRFLLVSCRELYPAIERIAKDARLHALVATSGCRRPQPGRSSGPGA
jgi:hypothetical protein